ncbi:sulfide:quinone oxidoreductase [Solimonas aquatica]|uniref:Sulfide-quinone reductase n=1 Tax=Solimonas aquatica TaxID=489703 RepID=A0A1H9MD08_9GAMM|nr:FAD-dependent oxidoreductase [Solimonas aquatica]SER21522.1 sulfide:quinone oxidoreductase [Solimonas aquatica]
MAKIVVMGAGVGGLPAAYDLRKTLGRNHEITVVSAQDHFQFTPSNPWVTVGWRTPEEICVPLAPVLSKKGIAFIPQAVQTLDPAANSLTLADGGKLGYDYLIIATGPKLAFDEIPGMGPQAHTQSVCTTPHAAHAKQAYEAFLKNPGPIVIGAVQGASCFGPAYEFALIVDADLRKRKLRHKVPMTFVTSEPYIGHMGLGGVGDSKGMLETAMRQRHIKWITNAKLLEAKPEAVRVAEHNDKGEVIKEHELPSKFNMFIPAFKGVDAVAAVKEMCNPRGFVLIDEFQRNPKYPNIYSAGVCVAIPPVEATPIATGAPKTGYMIESMVTAIVENIKEAIEGKAPTHRATWNAICLADMGDEGAAFVALPQIPPRNVTWAKQGKWVHLAKIAFEKYFIAKMRSGNSEPVFEKYVLKALGILRLQDKH